MTPTEEIAFWKSQFQILEKYKITYRKDGDFYQGCFHHKNGKQSHIFHWGRGRVPIPKDYIYHEILHICINAIQKAPKKERREKEELFVQDLCKIRWLGYY